METFLQDLSRRGITIHFISGAWSKAFVDLASPPPPHSGRRTLILASETIYSPLSLGAFSETLLALLHRPSSSGCALVAAKKVYFGVGGGVDEFLDVLKDISSHPVEVECKKSIETEGVGRLILQIK